MSQTQFEQYEAYKDSGVEWLGKVPGHWAVKRVKELSIIISKGTTPSTEGFIFTDKGIRFIKAENIGYTKVVSMNPSFYISEEANSVLSRSQLKAKDLLIVIAGATIGKVGIVVENLLPANTNQAVCFVRFRKHSNVDFLYYLFSSDYFSKYIWYSIVQSAQPNLSMGVLSNFILFIPSIPEQAAIAAYLDTKTAQIDRKIGLLSQKAMQYGKLKQVLINETVTRGLDKTVPLKDSGVEWLGEVPAHWEVRRLKELGFLFSGLANKSGEDFTSENKHSVPFVPFTNIANNFYLSKTNLKSVVVFPGEKQNAIRKFDMFFLMSSEDYADLGKSSLLIEDMPIPTYLNSFCKGFRFTRKDISSLFVNYLLHSSVYREHLSNEGKGFTRINLKMEKVNDIKLILPLLTEQIAIVAYLDEKTTHIDRIIATIHTQIEKLKELRKTLINDVVTGKIRVVAEGQTP